MVDHRIRFDVSEDPVDVPTGTLLAEAAKIAGVEIAQPCGGQGRCGRCAVQVTDGKFRRRSSLRLSAQDLEQGYCLACQTVVEGDLDVIVPPQEKVERRLTTDRTVAEIKVPPGYEFSTHQTIRRIPLTLPSPTIDDQIDDLSRLKIALRKQADISELHVSLSLLRQIGNALRQGNWQITAVIDQESWDCPECPSRLIDLCPGAIPDENPLWGLAIDIGTTTVTVWLVDLISGEVRAQVAEYNQQISRGEDVISRIIYSTKGEGGEELRDLVLATINDLVQRACKRAQVNPGEIYKASVTGNSTMMHLFLNLPAESIRLSPFVTGVNHIPSLMAIELGLEIHPQATVDCLPGVASYVGADITAGVLASGVDDSEELTLFLDVGTNGETVLGNVDWLVTCACSAGPAFEGAGVLNGMRATKGAIEEVWINGDTFEPTYRVIGDVKPRGLCGSGLISLLGEMLLTGVVDKGGHFNQTLQTERIREGKHGWEYVITWGDLTHSGDDLTITHVDVDNLLRAKAAIYAGFTVLASGVGVSLDDVKQVLIGGAFGKYINVEKAVEIGLLPDMPWDKFFFLGNTSVRGAYRALLNKEERVRVKEIASKMTYIELSSDNTFYEAFMSALFLPHTDLDKFPTVKAAISKEGQ